jgi:hypothetical protein
MVKRWTKSQRRHTLKYGGSILRSPTFVYLPLSVFFTCGETGEYDSFPGMSCNNRNSKDLLLGEGCSISFLILGFYRCLCAIFSLFQTSYNHTILYIKIYD